MQLGCCWGVEVFLILIFGGNGGMDGEGLGFNWEWDAMGLSGVVEATLKTKTNHLHQITATFSHRCCIYYYGDYVKRTSSHVEEVNKRLMERYMYI
jgi:hypothetical protein